MKTTIHNEIPTLTPENQYKYALIYALISTTLQTGLKISHNLCANVDKSPQLNPNRGEKSRWVDLSLSSEG